MLGVFGRIYTIIIEIRVLIWFSHIPKENSSKIAKLWNSLPLQAKLAQSEYTFKMNIKGPVTLLRIVQAYVSV
jgi:hypothetical protein